MLSSDLEVPPEYDLDDTAATVTTEVLEPIEAVSPAEEATQSDAVATEIATDSLAFGLAFMLGLNVFQRVVGLVRNVWVCRLMEPEELGRWNLAFSFLLLAAPLAVFGLPGVFGRYVEHYRHRGELRSFLRRVLLGTVSVAAVSLLVIALFPTTIAQLVFNDPSQAGLIQWSLGVLGVVIVFNYLTELMTALRQVRLVSIMQFCHSFVFAVVAITLLYATTWGTEAVVSAYAAGSLLAALMALPVLIATWRSLPAETNAASFGSMFHKLAPFAAWIWATNILTNLYNVADRYMLVHFASLDADAAAGLVGQYHSALIAPQLMLAAAVMFSGVMLPYLADHWESGDHKAVWAQQTLALKLVAMAFTVVGTILLVAAPILFGTILGGKYGEGLHVLPITIVQCIWAGMLMVASNYLWVRERPGLGSGALLVGLILNLGLNVMLVPSFGLQGAVIATAIANACALGLTYYLSAKLSMPITSSLLAISLLPAVLLGGPIASLILLLIVGGVAWKTDWLLSIDEKQVIGTTLHRFANRPSLARGEE